MQAQDLTQKKVDKKILEKQEKEPWHIIFALCRKRILIPCRKKYNKIVYGLLENLRLFRHQE